MRKLGKVTAVVMAAALAMSMGACGGSGDSGDKKDSDGSDKKSNGVKTGDNTPIVFYIGILAAALAVILVLVGNRYLKGRKRHE